MLYHIPKFVLSVLYFQYVREMTKVSPCYFEAMTSLLETLVVAM